MNRLDNLKWTDVFAWIRQKISLLQEFKSSLKDLLKSPKRSGPVGIPSTQRMNEMSWKGMISQCNLPAEATEFYLRFGCADEFYHFMNYHLGPTTWHEIQYGGLKLTPLVVWERVIKFYDLHKVGPVPYAFRYNW